MQKLGVSRRELWERLERPALLPLPASRYEQATGPTPSGHPRGSSAGRRRICEALQWVRPNGRLKSRECYEYLDLLEARGLVKLPARRVQRLRGPTSIVFTDAGREQPRRVGELSDVAT
jgi:hypothetical protein